MRPIKRLTERAQHLAVSIGFAQSYMTTCLAKVVTKSGDIGFWQDQYQAVLERLVELEDEYHLESRKEAI
jgi:hypothetical protein